jgi:hypothetical protein
MHKILHLGEVLHHRRSAFPCSGQRDVSVDRANMSLIPIHARERAPCLSGGGHIRDSHKNLTGNR